MPAISEGEGPGRAPGGAPPACAVLQKAAKNKVESSQMRAASAWSPPPPRLGSNMREKGAARGWERGAL